MEEINLIKCGMNLVETLITYLAKDAIGGEFLKEYLASRDEQEKAARLQQETMANLKTGTKSLGEKTREISENATQNIARLDQIALAIKNLQESVNKIDSEQKSYEEQFKNLIQQAKAITSKINDIQDISQQTNLLSFNASIEAARAGQAGVGFRVIANEVKKLSGETSKTSEEINRKVDSLTESITNLERLTKQNSANLQKLAEKAEATMTQFQHVKEINTQNNQNVGNVGLIVEKNIEEIDGVLESISAVEKSSNRTVQLFGECASRNEMLFNDLYSFVYELKAVFEDMK